MSPTLVERPVIMIREDLDNILAFSLPAPYTMRWYQPGDEEHWITIHMPSYSANSISLDLFRKQFGTDPQVLRNRQCYVLNANRVPVGTATAWLNDGYATPDYGRVHWVAIHPVHQGLGLAKPLLSAVCGRLKELGYTKAYLTTSTERVVAMRLYRGFGFVEVAQAGQL
jgi:ribosomal protein S18 acetylase RimI-like enzyme